MSLWEILREKEGAKFLTLDRGNEFDLLAVADRELVVSPRVSGEERTISRTEIEAGFLLLSKRGELSLQDFEGGQNSVNTSYVFALLFEHPSVQMRRQTLRLKYLPSGGPALPEGEFDPSGNTEFEMIETEEGGKQRRFWGFDSKPGR